MSGRNVSTFYHKDQSCLKCLIKTSVVVVVVVVVEVMVEIDSGSGSGRGGGSIST